MTISRHGRWYRRLLVLYPRPFRDRFGPAMCAAFEGAVTDARAHGRGAMVLLWIQTVSDALRLGLAERWATRRSGSTGPSPRAHHLQRNVTYALRQVRREPGLSAAIVVALALGIGLSTAAFSVVYGALWRGMPFDAPEQLVHFERAQPADGRMSMAVSHHDYLEWRERQTSFQDLAAYTEALVHLTEEGRPAERRYGSAVTPATLQLLGVQPHLGRLLTEADAASGAPAVALIGYDFWRQRYGGDSTLLGQRLLFNGVATEIVGIMPPRFGFPVDESLWFPLQVDVTNTPRGAGRLDVFGRLRPGVTLVEAEAEFAVISQQLAQAYPENQGIVAILRSFDDEYIGEEFSRSLLTMFVGALLVLFVACANVTNLLLTRTARRSSEFAVRNALGAGRRRLVEQLLTETALLAGIGAVLGTGIAHAGILWFTTTWIESGALDLPHGSSSLYWWSFGLDTVPLAFVLGVTLVTALGAGVAPALRAARTDVAAVLKDEARGSSNRRAGRLTQTLVLAEIALSVALLISAGLTVKSVLRTTAVGRDLDTHGITTARLGLPDRRLGMSDANYPDHVSRLRFWERIVEHLETDPRVAAATVGSGLPMIRAGTVGFEIEGQPLAADIRPPSANRAVVTPGFFGTYRVTAVAGRLFDERDRAGTEPVVVINQSLAQQYFASDSPLFRRLRFPGPEGAGAWLTIVGVVPDLWMDGSRNRDPGGLYLPMRQSLGDEQVARLGPWGLTFMALAVRTGDGGAAADLIRAAVAEVDGTVPVYNLQTMDAVVRRSVGQYRAYGTFYTSVGVIALVLSLLGVYSVLAASVAGRTREIGVRMALGAAAPRVVRGLVSQGAIQITAGLAIGSIIALWLTGGLEHALYGVDTVDVSVWATILGTFLVVGLVACYLPARRAARIDPADTLRQN